MNRGKAKCTVDDTKSTQGQPNHTASVFWKASQAHQGSGEACISFLFLATKGILYVVAC